MGARRRGVSAFTKTILRSIRGTLGRFLAIMGIVALGCGFYAGLQMCGPDMRADADRFYDGTNLYDAKVVSTLGFGSKDVERIAKVEGVESVMPAMSCDVLTRMGSEQLVLRMSSIDVGVANSATAQDDNTILSDSQTYLNRTFLREGSWPAGDDECVISADKPDADVGIGDSLEVLYGTSDLDDVLKKRTFKVVGTVSSSLYPYTGSFGSTTLGSGMIGMYAFVRPEAFVDDYPYTELYVTVEGARDELSGSDEYEEVVDRVCSRIEDDVDGLAEARLVDVRKESQEKLDDARSEYEQKKTDAQRELEDAKKKLDDALDEIEQGEKKLEDGQKEYDDGVAELDASRKKLDDAKRTLESSRQQLAQGRAELERGESSWQMGKQELLAKLGLDGQASLAQARSVLEAQKAELVQGRSQLEAGIAQATAGIGEAEAGIAQLEAGIAQLDAQIAQVPEGPQKEALVAQRAALATQLEQVRTQLQAAQATKEQLEQQLAQIPATDELDQGLAGVSQLESSRATLDASAAKLAQGQKELAAGEEEYASGQKQLAQGEAELEAAAAELQKGKSELADGRKAYEDGKKEYEKGRKEADEKLADAQKKIDDAQKKINDLELPSIYLLDRSLNEGVATHNADSHRIDSIADVFPFLFFLVAALVSLTTMTRMVADDRTEIGTYKALGYSSSRIASKYLCYAGAAGVVGATVGILVLSQVLPIIVTSSYAIIYTVPLHPLPLPIDVGSALAAGGLGVGVTLVATYAAVIACLREVPATLMLPRAPAAGKRILLERIGPLWRRLSFSWKVTCRNLFRYKRRLAMTVIGISGCTALLLVGFGLHDAIWDIIDCQYGPILHYNTTIGLNSDASKVDVDEVVRFLESDEDVQGIINVRQENMQAGSLNSEEDPMRVQVVIPQSAQSITNAITFRNRVDGATITINDDAVVVTEKISLKYGVGTGDEIILFDQDDIGNVVGDGHALVITGVAENYVGNLVYVGRNAWKSVKDEDLVFSTVFCSVDKSESAMERLAEDLHDFENVSTVIFSNETIDVYRNMLSVVDLVVVLLIVSAGLLAFIVLYNLTNINIEERVREIASLKVLGFTKREVYAYIFREIMLLALLGDALGMVLGTFLETFVVTTAEVDYVMFGRTIHPMSYVYGFAITLVFTVLILFVMRHKLDQVNMVESLKSVE